MASPLSRVVGDRAFAAIADPPGGSATAPAESATISGSGSGCCAARMVYRCTYAGEYADADRTAQHV